MTDPRTSDRGADTAPSEAVHLSPAEAGRAAADVSTVLLVRLLVAAVAAMALLVAAALLFGHARQSNIFPPYVTGGGPTVITRYSAPWISASAGAALLAGLSFTSFGVDLFRRTRLRRDRLRRDRPSR